ncbi:hypothetical protein MBAV_004089 [Candidatus Magnetobacterium bavaricum]|uniref:Uncharacterized protein n=1 Tax=Candidatus Magnetobacterium bavaricum TaxID=29290 RepID=A0A0F3GP46_9BACT|nr:hypothetical protein MBAV_004089 [Candidatus Magnetobacterium bavaricum]
MIRKTIINSNVIVQVYNRKMHCEQDIMGSRGLVPLRGGSEGGQVRPGATRSGAAPFFVFSS